MQAHPHSHGESAAARPASAGGAGPARPGVGGVDVAALLAAVREVPGVRDAQVRTSADGDRTLRLELTDGADPAAVAAEVADVLDERLGVIVDPSRSTVSTDAGVGTSEQVLPLAVDGPRRRVLVQRLQVVTGHLDVAVEVALSAGDAKSVGTAVGPAVEPAVLRAVASATLGAVDGLIEGQARCGLDQAAVVEIGADRVAVVVVTLLTPGRVDRLAGAAVVRGDARQAMVRAVLGALNRRLDALLPDATGVE